MLSRILSLVAPHECLGCSREGILLCQACITALPLVAEQCYRCHALSPGGKTCQKCRALSSLHAVQPATSYRELAKDLVWELKFTHARAAVVDMARCLAQRVVFDDQTILVAVPTATSRARQRGFDQAALLARALGRQTSLPRQTHLARSGQARQVGASRKTRIEHLASAFRAVNEASLRGRHIVLVDDVLTTGATLEAAAKTLKRAGAAKVSAVVFAQA